MSFYRAILEEEMTVLDNDNDSSAQVDELMDEIDDQDANAEEQEEAAEAAFGPDDNVDNIIEESYIAIAESTAAWNQIMHSIGMRELNEAARGREVMTEGVKEWFKEAKDKIVAFFKKIWSVIQRWMGNMSAHFRTNKSFIAKYSAEIRKGYGIFKSGNADLKKDVTGYEFGKTTRDAWVKKVTDRSDKFFTNAANAIKSNISNDIDMSISSPIHSDKFKINFDNGDTDLRSFVTDALRGNGGDKTDLNMTGDSVIEIIKGYTADKKETKKLLEATKKDMKAALRILDTLEKKADSQYKSDKDAEESVKSGNSAKRTSAQKTASVAYTNMRQAISDAQIVRSCILASMAQEMRQARRIGNLYVRLANRDKNKGFRESANTEYGYLGSLNLI